MIGCKHTSLNSILNNSNSGCLKNKCSFCAYYSFKDKKYSKKIFLIVHLQFGTVLKEDHCCLCVRLMILPTLLLCVL